MAQGSTEANHPRIRWVATAALIMLLAWTTNAQIKSMTAFTSKDDGFALKVPKKWDQIPPQPEDTHILAKWAADVMKRGTGESWELQVMRFSRRGGTTGSGSETPAISGGSEEGGEPGERTPEEIDELLKRMREENRPQNFREYYDRLYTEAKLREPEEIKVGSDKGLVYSIPDYSDWNEGTSAIAGVVNDGTYEWVIFYLVPKKEVFPDGKENAKTGVKTAILGSIASLKLFAATRRSTPAGQDDLDEIDKKILEVKRGLPDSWEIIPTPKRQYVIVHNIPRKKTRQLTFAKNIVKYLEHMRENYEVIFPPRKQVDAISVVRVCQDREEYHQYGGPGGSAGYFSPATGELVIYDASGEGDYADSYSTLFHEAYHQYLYYAVGRVSAHRWFDEGYGDYFAGANPKKDFRIEVFDWRSDTVKKAVNEGTNVHLRELVQYTQAEYYSNPQICYAQGWALIYFLKSSAAEKNEKWPGILQRYFDTLVETQRPDVAVTKAFEGVDYDELNAAYCEFIKHNFK